MVLLAASMTGNKRLVVLDGRRRCHLALGPQNREDFELRLKHRELAVAKIHKRLQNLLIRRHLRCRGRLNRGFRLDVVVTPRRAARLGQ
jgi:hypothetical protein